MSKEIMVVANWKMNPKSFQEAEVLLEGLKSQVKAGKNTKVVICPPFLWLSKLKFPANFKLGAQNCHWEPQGADTGEISAPMLQSLGVQYVILGHSECRQAGETDQAINLKIKAALRSDLKVILCVGERAGEEMNVAVEGQLAGCLEGVSANQMKDVFIAYEPVWAIGNSGTACEPDSALSAALFIKKILTKIYNRGLAEKAKILYGGSVEPDNAGQYIGTAMMDGLLVGRASLDAEKFAAIIKSVSKA